MIITKAMIVKELTDAIRKDQANRYRLVKDWTLPRLNRHVSNYSGKLIFISDSTITIRAYDGDVCNGATLSPDRIGSWNIVPGTLFHDAWYAEVDQIAEVWGWSTAEVRKLGDEVFACILAGTGVPVWLARAYFTGVRLGGGLVRTFGKLIGVSMLAICAGCGGCAMPNVFEDDKPVTPPQYQETTNGPGK